MDQKRNLSKIKSIVVLYHGGCPDGFGGAWAAWKHFGKRATYIPLSRQESPPLYLKHKTLYFIDFVYSVEIMKKFMSQNVRVTAIDHHVSGERATKVTVEPLYAVKHSGAVLAWNYFHRKKPIPRMLRHIEDDDIWRYALPHTAEVHLLLSVQPFAFPAWDRFARKLQTSRGRKEIIRDGSLLLAFRTGIVNRLAQNAELVRFHGRKVYALNAGPFFTDQVAHFLYEKLPPMAIVWNHSHGSIKVSLRSNGAVDVSKIAEKYGGGGHRGAAGFVVPAGKPLPWRYTSKK
jgi:hypothetical protein